MFNSLKARLVLAGLVCMACMASVFAKGDAALPPALAGATEGMALPGGAWLALYKQSVRLIDATGAERGRINVRGKHLDARAQGQGALGVVLEADTQRTLALSVDLHTMQLVAKPAVESPAYSVEALCQYRDTQGLDYVFLVGDEGLTEQWVLRAEGALLVRRLALPPQTHKCVVDDVNHRLFANQQDLGVWVFHAEAERKPQGQAVAMRKPFGPLHEEAKSIQLAGDTLATVDARGEMRLWKHEGASWRSTVTRALPSLKVVKPSVLPMVLPRVQTQSVARFGDAADDPAIWVHPTDASLSLVLGTNKKQGLLVYDLVGRERQLLEVGRVNNVDLRQQVRFDNQTLDLAVATQRDDLSVVVFAIGTDGVVREHSRIPTGLKEIYGVCLYQPTAGGLEVFVNDKDGSYLRYRLRSSGQTIESMLVQRFKVASQPEACVADDAAARLFIGEEKRGVWVMDLNQPVEQQPDLKMALPVGGLLVADTEGLGLYKGATASYMVVSSQGNNSYVVTDAAPPYKVRGAFRIGMNLAARIDGASETDGLEVTSRPLGPAFPRGALVVQDGFKRLPDGPQNFKIVAWEDIAAALNLP